MFIKFKLIN